MSDPLRLILDAALDGAVRIEIDDSGDVRLVPTEPQRLVFTDGKWVPADGEVVKV